MESWRSSRKGFGEARERPTISELRQLAEVLGLLRGAKLSPFWIEAIENCYGPCPTCNGQYIGDCDGDVDYTKWIGSYEYACRQRPNITYVY